MARGLAGVRERGGRLFILGVGGGAGHASHAVNDFRKLCLIESYAPTDNVSELTARTNDDGWETAFSDWLEVSRLGARDALLVFSVGGGSREQGVSVNLVSAMELAYAGRRFDLRSGRRSGRRARATRRSGDPAGAPAGAAHAAGGVAAGGGVARAGVPPRPGPQTGPLGVARRPRPAVSGRAGVFLDRDGVLNELVPDPASGSRSRRCASRTCACSPGAPAAARRLARAGFALACVSNQPAAAKGLRVGARSCSPCTDG